MEISTLLWHLVKQQDVMWLLQVDAPHKAKRFKAMRFPEQKIPFRKHVFQSRFKIPFKLIHFKGFLPECFLILSAPHFPYPGEIDRRT